MGSISGINAYIFLEGKGKTYRFHFRKDITLIGKSNENDIIIKDPNILPHHAQITYSNGQFFLRPIEATLLKVNGERADMVQPLFTGDIIEFGNISAQMAIDEGKSDACILFIITKKDNPPVWIITARTNINICGENSDLFLPELFSKGTIVVENYGEGCHFITNKGNIPDVTLGEEPLEGLRRLFPGDVLKIDSFLIKLFFFKSAFMDNPEESLIDKGLLRFRLDSPLYLKRRPEEIKPQPQILKTEKEVIEKKPFREEKESIRKSTKWEVANDFDLIPVSSRDEKRNEDIDYRHEKGHTIILALENQNNKEEKKDDKKK